MENNIDIEPIYLLKMTCPSTGQVHAVRVPPKVRSYKASFPSDRNAFANVERSYWLGKLGNRSRRVCIANVNLSTLLFSGLVQEIGSSTQIIN